MGPDRPTDVEAGIDLADEDTEGHLWPIQAKAYKEAGPNPEVRTEQVLSESKTVNSPSGC
jgi:hypothetical protein